MEYEELTSLLLPANLAQASYQFETEDKYIVKKFGLQDLMGSYDPKQLVPEETSLKVAKAYSHIKKTGLEEKGYFEQSVLGRKIQAVRDHDRNYIIRLVAPIVKEVDFSKKDWDKQIENKISELIKQEKKSNEKKFGPIKKDSEACHERIKRYVQKSLPAQW